MKLTYSDHFKKRLKKRLKNSPKLKIKINKQLRLLKLDTNYLSLKTHKLKGKHVHEYAIWVEDDLRITYVTTKEGLVLTDVIKHDEY